MAVMPHVSRSLIALLIGTVAFFAVWIVAFRPSSSSSNGKSALGQLQPAVDAAKASAAAQNRAAAAAGNTTAPATAKPATAATTATATKPAAATAATKATATTKPATPAAPRAATPSQRLNVVDKALSAHKVLALLFYNPAAPDDQAVKRELGTIPTSAGRVVKLAVPITEVANYPVVTNQVQIQTSPTLVIVDKKAQAFTLVGFADTFEIAHRVGDALSVR
jgi:hypothetical protein